MVGVDGSTATHAVWWRGARTLRVRYAREFEGVGMGLGAPGCVSRSSSDGCRGCRAPECGSWWAGGGRGRWVDDRFGRRRGPGGARAGPGRHAVDAREVAGALPGRACTAPHSSSTASAVRPSLGRRGPAGARPRASVAASRRVWTAPIFSLGPGSPAPLSSALEPAVDRAPRGLPPDAGGQQQLGAPAPAAGRVSLPFIVSLLFLGSWGLSPVVPSDPLPRTARQKKARTARAIFSLPATWAKAAGRVNGGRRGKGSGHMMVDGTRPEPPHCATNGPGLRRSGRGLGGDLSRRLAARTGPAAAG